MTTHLPQWDTRCECRNCGVWLEGLPTSMKISYGLCPSCLDKLIEKSKQPALDPTGVWHVMEGLAITGKN